MLSGTVTCKRKQQLHQVDYTNFALFSQNKDPEFWVLEGQEERRRRKIFSEGKYFFLAMRRKWGEYMEKDFFGGEEEERRKGRKLFGKGKHLFGSS